MLGNGDGPENPEAPDTETSPLPEEPEGTVEAKGDSEAKYETKPPENTAFIKDGVMSITLHLERSPSGYAEAIGSLVLSQDLVKNYFAQKAMYEAALKARATSGIIRPKFAH